MGFDSSRVNAAIVSRQEQRAFIPIYGRRTHGPASIGRSGREIQEKTSILFNSPAAAPIPG